MAKLRRLGLEDAARRGLSLEAVELHLEIVNLLANAAIVGLEHLPHFLTLLLEQRQAFVARRGASGGLGSALLLLLGGALLFPGREETIPKGSKAVALYYWDGKSMEEIADEMGLKNDKVAKNYKGRAMKLLKEMMRVRKV